MTSVLKPRATTTQSKCEQVMPEAIIVRFPAGDTSLKAARTWGRSSAGRASQWHCEGQGFDPPRLHQRSQELSFGRTSRTAAQDLLQQSRGKHSDGKLGRETFVRQRSASCSRAQDKRDAAGRAAPSAAPP